MKMVDKILMWFILGAVLLSAKPCGAQSEICRFLRQRGVIYATYGYWHEAYDTLKLFIEHCAHDSSSAAEFYKLTDAVNEKETGDWRWDAYREWLKKVLYYNTVDWRFYCADVNAILYTFFQKKDLDLLGGMAVSKYVLETERCRGWSFADSFAVWLPGVYELMYDAWLDTAKDPLNTKPDSTLPTLEELHLEILLGPANVSTPKSSIGKEIISFIAAQNPFENELNLNFELSSNALVRIEIVDRLGRNIYSEGLGWRSSGKYPISLSNHDWASGTYYARLSTLRGHVKTVKLIKQ